jgi:spore coat polysaccharide biosynthesis predicted glycosyltransferase SpsG
VVKKFISNIDFDLYDTDHSFKGRHFDIAIVDVPGIASRKEKHLQRLSDLIVCIDDEGPGLAYQDILIRPNLLNLPKPSDTVISSDCYWSGRDYIILHPDFAVAADQKKSQSKKVKELLVCFGGSDQCGLTVRVIPVLRNLATDLKIHIVLGAAFVQDAEVASALKGDPRFSVSRSVLSMAQHFRNADVSLISGGTLLYEACSLGIPSVVVSQNEPQETESRICAAAGAVLSLGVNSSVLDAELFAGLQRLIEDGSLRENMAKQGPGIVSPDGAGRIVSRLRSYVRKEAG